MDSKGSKLWTRRVASYVLNKENTGTHVSATLRGMVTTNSNAKPHVHKRPETLCTSQRMRAVHAQVACECTCKWLLTRLAPWHISSKRAGAFKNLQERCKELQVIGH
eukprot:2250442-Pleurochrysis_carterae.AAC.2